MVIGKPDWMTDEKFFESMLNVLKRSFNNGIFTFDKVTTITRGTLTEKQIHITMKPDKRMRRLPEMHIAVSHARVYQIEDIMFQDDGSILLCVTIKPERY